MTCSSNHELILIAHILLYGVSCLILHAGHPSFAVYVLSRSAYHELTLSDLLSLSIGILCEYCTHSARAYFDVWCVLPHSADDELTLSAPLSLSVVCLMSSKLFSSEGQSPQEAA